MILQPGPKESERRVRKVIVGRELQERTGTPEVLGRSLREVHEKQQKGLVPRAQRARE